MFNENRCHLFLKWRAMSITIGFNPTWCGFILLPVYWDVHDLDMFVWNIILLFILFLDWFYIVSGTQKFTDYIYRFIYLSYSRAFQHYSKPEAIFMWLGWYTENNNFCKPNIPKNFLTFFPFLKLWILEKNVRK